MLSPGQSARATCARTSHRFLYCPPASQEEYYIDRYRMMDAPLQSHANQVIDMFHTKRCIAVNIYIWDRSYRL